MFAAKPREQRFVKDKSALAPFHVILEPSHWAPSRPPVTLKSNPTNLPIHSLSLGKRCRRQKKKLDSAQGEKLPYYGIVTLFLYKSFRCKSFPPSDFSFAACSRLQGESAGWAMDREKPTVVQSCKLLAYHSLHASKFESAGKYDIISAAHF